SSMVALVHHISPSGFMQGNVQYDNRSFQFPVNGFNSNVVSIRALKLDEGRFYGPEDELQRGRVAVIGSEAKTKLFSGQYALGEHIRINGMSFEVIGVLAAKMQEGDDNINRAVYIPFVTMGDLKDTRYLDGIWVDYESMEYEKIEANIRT